MSMMLERAGALAGLLLGCYAMVWCGWQLALWAVRTGRVDPRKVTGRG